MVIFKKKNIVVKDTVLSIIFLFYIFLVIKIKTLLLSMSRPNQLLMLAIYKHLLHRLVMLYTLMHTV